MQINFLAAFPRKGTCLPQSLVILLLIRCLKQARRIGDRAFFLRICRFRLEFLAAPEHRPQRAQELVGQSHDCLRPGHPRHQPEDVAVKLIVFSCVKPLFRVQGDGVCALHHQRPDVDAAGLGDASRSLPASGGVLRRDQAVVGGKLFAAREGRKVCVIEHRSEPGKKHDSERQKDDLTGKTVPDDEADDDAYKLGGGR